MKTILVVEDDQSIRENLRTLLEMEGYEVLLAANGLEAIELLKTCKKPNLILLDLMMPVMDGFKFREIQLTQPENAAIPVLIMSADGNVATKKAAIGASDYLRKPVEVDELLERIAKYF